MQPLADRGLGHLEGSSFNNEFEASVAQLSRSCCIVIKAGVHPCRKRKRERNLKQELAAMLRTAHAQPRPRLPWLRIETCHARLRVAVKCVPTAEGRRLEPVTAEATAWAPATVANLGPGFDWMGCAVNVRVHFLCGSCGCVHKALPLALPITCTSNLLTLRGASPCRAKATR